nr:myosin IC light chain [Acanthamoeba castellanii]
MGDKLDDEMVDEIKQAFAKFDKDKDGRVNALELGKIMREMGHNPTYGELETMIKENGGGGVMDVNGFLGMVAKNYSSVDNERDLIEAFQVFDKDGKGFISVMELRSILCNMGEKLTDQEVEEMLRNACIQGDGNVDYTAFVRHMLARDQ